jgi:hypothetical protein
MQQTPVVSAPKEQRGRNWYPIIGAMALILCVILIAYAIANPVQVVEAPAAADVAANPELIVFERYQQTHAAAIDSAKWHQNPELAVFEAYRLSHPGQVSLSENPEVGVYQRWLEGR